MTNETIAAFIAALPEKRQARCAEALKLVTATSVYNADYVEAKFILGRSVDEAWDALKVPYDLYRHVGSVMCLHDIISMSKKVNKAGFNLDAIEPLRALCAAFLPVALLMKDLKNKTIKARKPASAEVQAERALTAINAGDAKDDFLCLMTDRQQRRLAYVVREVMTVADHFGKEEMVISVTAEVVSKGRKGSPNRSFWVGVKVDLPNRVWGGAMAYGSIGKRGAVGVTIHDRSIAGRETKLGKR